MPHPGTRTRKLSLVTVVASFAACTAHDVTHPELRSDLLDWRERDQEGRNELVALMRSAPPGEVAAEEDLEERRELAREVAAIDAAATAFLKQVVDEFGWPTRAMVGRDGASAAWILAQHADRDPEFQARALELMAPLVETGQAAPGEFALLTDRVRLAQGQKQLYGTQFAPDENGIRRPRPVEDPENLDARRQEMGLSPIADYARDLGRSYGQPTSPEPLSSEPMPSEPDRR